MKELFGIPVVESEEAGDSIFLLPKVQPVVFIPSRGYSPDEMRAAERAALIEAYTQAARRGEIGIIKNVAGGGLKDKNADS